MAAKQKKARAKRELSPQLRQKIVAAGRRRERPKAGVLAEELGTDVHVVRRVWQAAGLLDVKAPVKARAQKLVATWLKRGRSA